MLNRTQENEWGSTLDKTTHATAPSRDDNTEWGTAMHKQHEQRGWQRTAVTLSCTTGDCNMTQCVSQCHGWHRLLPTCMCTVLLCTRVCCCCFCFCCCCYVCVFAPVFQCELSQHCQCWLPRSCVAAAVCSSLAPCSGLWSVCGGVSLPDCSQCNSEAGTQRLPAAAAFAGSAAAAGTQRTGTGAPQATTQHSHGNSSSTQQS